MAASTSAVLSGERWSVFPASDVREAELSQKEEAEAKKRVWDGLIDDTLVEWGGDMTVLEDEGFVPPNPEVIGLACEVALHLRNEAWDPPTSIVPDGEGGISFERVEGARFASLNIYADQSVELLNFDDCRLRSRRRLS